MSKKRKVNRSKVYWLYHPRTFYVCIKLFSEKTKTILENKGWTEIPF